MLQNILPGSLFYVCFREYKKTTHISRKAALKKAKQDAAKYFLGDRNIFVLIQSNQTFDHAFDYSVDVTQPDSKPWIQFEFYQGK